MPNPFNPKTEIRFALPEARPIDCDVYDASGRLVRILARDAAHAAGLHGLVWDGRDDAGRTVSAGTYVYRLRAGGDRAMGRLTLLK